jgi:hypothetical protein
VRAERLKKRQKFEALENPFAVFPHSIVFDLNLSQNQFGKMADLPLLPVDKYERQRLESAG